MSTKRRTRAATLVVALALLATACGSDGETSPVDAVSAAQETESGQPTPSTTSTTQPAPAETPSTIPAAADPAEDDYGDPANDDAYEDEDSSESDAAGELLEIGTVSGPGEAVPPGTYTVDLLGEEWHVTTGEHLFVQGSDQKLMVARAESWGSTGPNFMLLTRVVGIVPPREAGIHQEHHPVVPEVTVDLPDSLETWFDAVPQVEVIDTGTLTVAGEPASWWQLTVDPAAGDTFHCPIGDHCAGFVVHENLGVFVLSSERDITVWQLEVIPDVIGFVQTVDTAAGTTGRRAMADVLAGLAAA